MAIRPDAPPPYKEFAYYPHDKILFVLEQNPDHDDFGRLDARTFFSHMRADLQAFEPPNAEAKQLMALVLNTSAYPHSSTSRQSARRQVEPIRIRTGNNTQLSIFQGYIDNVDARTSPPKVAPLGSVINFIYTAISSWQSTNSSEQLEPSARSSKKSEVPSSKPPVWNLGHSQNKNFGEIRLISPDWLGGSSSISGSQTPTGGPESEPLPVTVSPPPALQYPLPAAFMQMIGSVTNTSLIPNPSGVDVYILDTVPKFANLELRHNRLEQDRGVNNPMRRFWGQGNFSSIATQLDGNPLPVGNAPSEFKANDRNFYYVESLPNCNMNSFIGIQLSNTDYPIPDHGLFIASIISTIVNNPPSTRVSPLPVKYHLIQILNDYGIGTLSTMIAGLEKVQQLLQPDHPSIVNCSFTLSLPIDGHIDNDLDEEMTILFNGTFFEAVLIEIINLIFASATIPANGEMVDGKQDCMIVAAAGNDSNDPRPGGTLPAQKLLPRYPAAADVVVGVGACDLNRQLTNYTNHADIPDTKELYAFGGAPNGQIMGLFTSSPFPLPATGSGGSLGTAVANTTGLAYWSGTSFAAPIISGALALYCAYNRTSVQKALDAVRACAVNKIFM